MSIGNTESQEQFLTGGGEMGKLIRSMDWSKTALGPVEQWPQSLRTTVSLCLSSTFPILIAWGPETIQIYNDSYLPICGAKHPESMGQNFKICWETALPVVGDAFDRGFTGEGTYIKDQQMLLDRYGYIEEAFMTFSFAPIRDETGQVGGIFHPITETTDKMLSARRTQVLRDIAAEIGTAKTKEQICEQIVALHNTFEYDIPFIQIHELEKDADHVFLKATAGLSDFKGNVNSTDLSVESPDQWPFKAVLDSMTGYQVSDLQSRFGVFKSGPFENAPGNAMIFPIRIAGQQLPFGFLVAGVSSARAMDQEYLNFFELLSNTVNTAFSNVHAYQMEQLRAEQLAEIDKAKTAFFSNVSHEFRTPLTLILGPLQEILSNTEIENLPYKDSIESVHRNALRLLKLVNNLLDFSRMEAGRVKAGFQKVNLNTVTQDLASNFRSIIEKAGMELLIENGQQDLTAYIDMEMWEKIVLNLLSNAFKFTLQGKITVSLKEQQGKAVLTVSDTGVGIAEHELPHMFERFHRIENSQGRTHEGTGIGLSLVYELVKLHFGTISVSSIEGQGTSFEIQIPLGKDHIRPEQILNGGFSLDSASTKGAYVREAISLLGEEEEDGEAGDTIESDHLDTGYHIEIQKDLKILVVDDNADMRQYLSRLLSTYFTVERAVNGKDALEKLEIFKPDIIVSDIMMPVMDGIQMLAQIRQKSLTERIPVIFLSARAGEEAKLDGISSGADDYLVKPFSAKELLTKVGAQIKINRSRKEAEIKLRDLFLKAPVAIGIFSGPNLVIELANAMILQYWGLVSEQVIGKPFNEAIAKMPTDGFDQIALKVMRTGKKQILREYPVEVSRNGKVKKLYLNLIIEPLKSDSISSPRVMVIANDITEHVLSMDFIRDSEERFRLLASSMPQLVWAAQKDQQLSFYNDLVAEYSGLSREQIQTSGLLQLIHPDDLENHQNAWDLSIQSGQDLVIEHRYKRHDGEYRWHLTRAAAKMNALGEIDLWIGSSTDIHEQKTVEERLEKHVVSRTQELKTVNEQLLKTNRELEQFAYVASHDLQEPLRKIQVFSDLMGKNIKESEPQIINYLERINKASGRMSLLINDLLAYSRITNYTLEFTITDLNVLLAEVIADFDLLIEQKQAIINVGSLPKINALPSQIRQLFSNLIGNALKFSRPLIAPLIEIYCRPISGMDADYPFTPVQTDFICIRVSDNGIGFDQQYADQIFTIFQRLHARQDYVGSGIGLAICKRVVENHQGSIRAVSKLGIGSVFEIYLPALTISE